LPRACKRSCEAFRVIIRLHFSPFVYIFFVLKQVADAYFRAGADKVSLGSDAVESAKLFLDRGGKGDGTSAIETISAKYGAQACVVSIDPRYYYNIYLRMPTYYYNIYIRMPTAISMISTHLFIERLRGETAPPPLRPSLRSTGHRPALYRSTHGICITISVTAGADTAVAAVIGAGCCAPPRRR